MPNSMMGRNLRAMPLLWDRLRMMRGEPISNYGLLQQDKLNQANLATRQIGGNFSAAKPGGSTFGTQYQTPVKTIGGSGAPTAGGVTWAPMGQMGQDAAGNPQQFRGNGGSFGMNPYAGQARIGNKGGVMAPPSPNALEVNGRAGMGSLDPFYASRASNPITGLPLNPSANDIQQQRAKLSGAFGNKPDFENLGLHDAYNSGMSSNNPYLSMAAGSGIQDVAARRARAEARRLAGLPSEDEERDWMANPGTMAKGGHANSMNPYLVGEKGPEVFVPKHGMPRVIGDAGPEVQMFEQDGTVIPNHKIKRMEHGGHVRKAPFNWFSFLNRPEDTDETPEWKQEMDQYNQSAPIVRGRYNAGDALWSGLRGAGRAAAWPFVPPSPTDIPESGYSGVGGSFGDIPESRPLSPSMFANRTRGVDDMLKLNRFAPAFAGSSPADRIANGVTPAQLPSNPYASLPAYAKLGIAMADARQGINNRSDAGEVTFDNGGGIAIGPNGQKVAYGPHVVSNSTPVKFTVGHVKDELGDFHNRGMGIQAPSLAQAVMAKAALPTEQSGRDLETSLGIPHLGDAGTMTGIPMAPKATPESQMSGRELENLLGVPHVREGRPIPKLSTPFVAGGYPMEQGAPKQFFYGDTPAAKLWPTPAGDTERILAEAQRGFDKGVDMASQPISPPLSPMALAIMNSERGLSSADELPIYANRAPFDAFWNGTNPLTTQRPIDPYSGIPQRTGDYAGMPRNPLLELARQLQLPSITTPPRSVKKKKEYDKMATSFKREDA